MARVAAGMMALSMLVGACGSPTSPTASDGYAGQWSGTTAQGRPVAFTISANEMVTSITLGHDFNGCSGSQTYSNLQLSMAPQVICVPGPCSAALLSYRSFSYGSGTRIDEPSTSINALFLSTSRAEGTINFRNYSGCGDAIGVSWSAQRR